MRPQPIILLLFWFKKTFGQVCETMNFFFLEFVHETQSILTVVHLVNIFITCMYVRASYMKMTRGTNLMQQFYLSS